MVYIFFWLPVILNIFHRLIRHCHSFFVNAVHHLCCLIYSDPDVLKLLKVLVFFSWACMRFLPHTLTDISSVCSFKFYLGLHLSQVFPLRVTTLLISNSIDQFCLFFIFYRDGNIWYQLFCIWLSVCELHPHCLLYVVVDCSWSLYTIQLCGPTTIYPFYCWWAFGLFSV